MEDKKNGYAIRCFSGRNSKLRFVQIHFPFRFCGSRVLRGGGKLLLEVVGLLARYLFMWSLKIASGKRILCLFCLRVRSNVSFRFAEYREPRCNLSLFKSLRCNFQIFFCLRWWKTHVGGFMSDSQYRKTSSSSAEMQMICWVLTKFRKGNFSEALPTKFFPGKNLTDSDK